MISKFLQILGLQPFKISSWSLEHFFLTVGQNNFGNKIPFYIFPILLETLFLWQYGLPSFRRRGYKIRFLAKKTLHKWWVFKNMSIWVVSFLGETNLHFKRKLRCISGKPVRIVRKWFVCKVQTVLVLKSVLLEEFLYFQEILFLHINCLLHFNCFRAGRIMIGLNPVSDGFKILSMTFFYSLFAN